jgi:hypothetical protein
MTVAADLATAAGIHRRLYIKIDGLPDTLWQPGNYALPGWAGRTHRACLSVRSEFSSDLDLGGMQAGMSAMEFELSDIQVAGVSYFGQLFAPARWSAAGNDHARVAAGGAPETYLDADSATIPLVDSTTLGASGTGYIGQETVSWTGNAANTLTGVTKGLYPCVGSGQYGYTYKRPELATKGASMHVGEVPYSWLGRRVALYVHTYDKSSADWQPEAQGALLWCGRISDEIRQDGATGAWVLSCVSILDDLDVEIAADMPEGRLNKINLQGEHGRKFRVAYTSGGYWVENIVINKGAYTPAELFKEVNAQMQASAFWAAGLWVWVELNEKTGKSRLGARTSAGLGDVNVLIHSTDKHFCHAMCALGFEEDGSGVILNSSAQSSGAAYKDGTCFETYHPLSQDCNGGHLYIVDEAEFWADQGDNAAARGFVKIEDANLDVHRKKEGTYLASYSALDAGNSRLTLAAYVDGPYGENAYVGHKINEQDQPTMVKQVYAPQWKHSSTGAIRGPFELLLYSLLSSGTASYNDATYDDLPLALSVGMQSDLVDTASFLAASKAVVASPLAHRTAYVIDEPISWNELAKREAQLFGYAPVWRRGQIAMVQVLDPDVAGWDLTLDEGNNLENPAEPEWPTMKMSTDTVVNQYNCKFQYDNTTGKYGPPIVITDVDSAQGLRITKAVTIEHPGVYRGLKSSDLRKLLPGELMGRGLRFPSPMVQRSLAPTLLNKIYTGDVVKLISNRIMDPDGSGLLSTNVLALVLGMRWNYALDPDDDAIRPAGNCTLMLLSQWANFGNPWAPAALVDKSAANGGLDAATNRLTLVALEWGAAGDTDDGAAFELADEVLVIERAPSDPTAPTTYGPFGVASAYETDGANILTLDGDGIWAGWDATMEHIVVPADYGTATADQRTRGIWQATTGTMLLGGADKARRYG